jgi:hypothetical protein
MPALHTCCPHTLLRRFEIELLHARGDEGGGGFARGGIARVHDGEVVVPRPFSDEFPALSAALARSRSGDEWGGGRAAPMIHVTLELDGEKIGEKTIRLINRKADAGEKSLSGKAVFETSYA